MTKFEIIRLPLMSAEGLWVSVAPNQWNTNFDARGMLNLKSKGISHVLSFGNLLAIEIGNEEEVTAVGKTLGRMALTGVGAALFSQGRSGGMGASILDLSIRGAEKNL